MTDIPNPTDGLVQAAYATLTLLEVTGESPVTAVQRRSASLLTDLVDAGLVALTGAMTADETPMMTLTDEGRSALEAYRKSQTD